jgi:hypothetical protein
LKKITTILALLLCGTVAFAQELFPLSEPASSMPKNVLGIRLFSETYKEVTKIRNMSYLRLMYGVTPKLSVYLTGIASNHHGEKFPVEFPFHNTPERGAKYPYKFNGFNLYAKYRFLSEDGENSHFRMAAFAEGTLVKTTHHETEPDLEEGDNTGIGAGLITTYLKGKFAVSATIGGVLPQATNGNAPDPIDNLPDVPIRLQYGKALSYDLSFGYRLLPLQYKNYNQTNINLYMEFHGEAYQTAKVNLYEGQYNEYFLGQGSYPPALHGGYYVDVSPGVQFIINSNLRIDCATTFHVTGQTFARLYPVYSIGIQQYLFFNKKS